MVDTHTSVDGERW